MEGVELFEGPCFSSRLKEKTTGTGKQNQKRICNEIHIFVI